jgi:hypothetical protein
MDIGKAFGFVFEDEEWVTKLLLGTVILLIPIFGMFAALGYVIALIRKVMVGDARPLPAWQDIGQRFMDGLMFWIASMIYTLPMWILMCPIMVIWVLPVLGGENEDLMTILAGVAGIVGLVLICLMTLYGIVMALLAPVLQIRYAESGELGACLRLGEVFRFLFDNIGPILISQVIVWAVSMVVGIVVGVLSGVASMIPICGWIVGPVLGLLMLPFAFWMMVFSAHLYGQIARQAGIVPVVAGASV